MQAGYRVRWPVRCFCLVGTLQQIECNSQEIGDWSRLETSHFRPALHVFFFIAFVSLLFILCHSFMSLLIACSLSFFIRSFLLYSFFPFRKFFYFTFQAPPHSSPLFVSPVLRPFLTPPPLRPRMLCLPLLCLTLPFATFLSSDLSRYSLVSSLFSALLHSSSILLYPFLQQCPGLLSSSALLSLYPLSLLIF